MASVLAACLKSLWDPMTHQLAYIFYLGRKLTELEKNKMALASAKADVLVEVENAKIIGCTPTATVINWLREADNAVVEAEDICSNARSIMENSTCFRIKIVMRYKLGKQILRASKFSSDVQGRKPGDLFVPPPPVVVLPFPTSLIKNNTSSFRTLEKLRNFLQDDSIGKIGVWGMGGVGKTRLLRNLNNELQETKRFDVVIFVTVSKNWNKDMQKLRNDIGKELYMELEKDNVRASRLLYKRLMQKKFLLILDDVWDKINLENLGIPSPTEHKGCKIAITTRQRGICNEMETDVEIMVEALPDEESWDLFHEKAGGNIPTTIENVARSVCRECCGLPLAIITVGSALRKEVHLDQWKRALRLLQKSNFRFENMEDSVFVPLKFSYDMLRDDQLKKCFLFVALFPEDHEIADQDLIEYWVMEGYIEGAESLGDAYQDAHRLLILLIDSCLLERSRKKDMVKMHDVIRDMAIKITSDGTEEGTKFWVKAGMRLEELVETEDLKDKDKISLMENNIQLIGVDLYCPNASTLLVKGNVMLYDIPERFFQYMKLLSVLDLSATSIEFLPESISVLVNLSALILKECARLKRIDRVQCLKKLRFLDMRESGIIELPEGIVHLTGLVYFKISCTYRLQKIPAGLIAQFSHLEDLEMNQSFYLEGLKNPQEIIKQFKHLKSLNNLSLDLENDKLSSLLETHCNLNNLASFYLRVGSVMATSKTEYVAKKEGPRKPERRGRCLDITGDAACKRLAKFANKLCVYQNRKLRSISQLGLDNLECVEECWVWDCQEMWSIIISEEQKDNTYPHLQLLHLERLPKLSIIFSYNVAAAPSFFNLRKINLCECNMIPFVFQEEMIDQLGCLEELDVSSCRILKRIIEGYFKRDGMCLPKLRCISFSQLGKLEQLWFSDLSLPSLVDIKIHRCPNLRPPRLTNELAPTLLVIEAEEQWWESLPEDEIFKLHFASILKPVTVSFTHIFTSVHASSSH
ncbi:probable disease resistance protein At4g27220 [Zingiber officinale]|uniref:probable disease resistance protein At4g27220 n=1 Tax=Zingiber officinale TaxID=94328 RepID=UPI001C4CCB6F|nr:probable disease resistance protein At4g27220 [Zingiber officinale]XP_042398833.1 probable disease resistance protein At4g27220 [Zingiber officinale]XP_042398834.1 probable disease resistance protein At4g27220 [Zingiber officinale]XP_042398835.1 probable disease resistance protein At4g27220 [Zingiber officinale]XP_042398836.1 probable disease resistance protein At4g27220 [Zingiber officinale]